MVMNHAKNIKGSVWNALGSTMYGLNSFIMLALVSRVGTVEEAGCFAIAFTTAQLLYIIGLFGVSHYQMTDYTERFRFSTYAKARVLSCILMLVCCGVSIALLGFSGIKRIYTVALTILMLLNVVGELYQSLFFQKNRLDLSGSALFYRTLWPLLLFCAVGLLTKNILLAVTVQIAANLIITAYYAVRVAPQFAANPSAGRQAEDTVTALVKECFSLAVSLFLMNIVINMSKYGIELVGDDTVQGYYGMIFMPAQVINLCSQFLFKPFLNQYSMLLTQRKTADFFSLLKKQILLVGGLTLVCCTAAYFLGTPVLGFLYGKDLSQFAIALTLVVFGGGIYAGCQLFYYILVILRQQRLIFWIYAGAAVLSVPLSLTLIGLWGILGAVLAFAGTHLVILLTYMVAIKHSL